MSKNKKKTKIVKTLRDAQAKADNWYQQYVCLLESNKELRLANDKLKHRLDVAGFTTPTLDESTGPVQVIEADIVPYGLFNIFTEEPTERDMEILRDELTLQLVRGMADQNMIQFIYKDPYGSGDPLNEHFTYAAKMYVIPWEQMRTVGRHVRLYEKIKGLKAPVAGTPQQDSAEVKDEQS